MVDEAFFVKAEDTILLKKAIAINLYNKKIEQLKISKILNLSQPMVSNYLSSNEKIPKDILNLAERISDKIFNGELTSFYTCITFDNNSLNGRLFIAEKKEIISEENSNIINNLTEAFFLLKGKDIGGLLPEVKVNIAMAKQMAKNTEDIAAFLNGLIIAEDKVTSNNGIRFGKSKHLSSLLLYLKDNLNVNAIMNIAYIKNTEKTNFLYCYLSKDFKLKECKKNIDILLHKGDFGIEPCAYVLGRDAVDVVNKVLKIRKEIK
jgi:predicted fused transcriptional regulator/phosphomethylpyrimidine kinase